MCVCACGACSWVTAVCKRTLCQCSNVGDSRAPAQLSAVLPITCPQAQGAAEGSKDLREQNPPTCAVMVSQRGVTRIHSSMRMSVGEQPVGGMSVSGPSLAGYSLRITACAAPGSGSAPRSSKASQRAREEDRCRGKEEQVLHAQLVHHALRPYVALSSRRKHVEKLSRGQQASRERGPPC